MKLIGTLDRTRAAVRVEDSFATTVDDLWDACTAPDRLARWIAEVDGDLRPGGQFRARFTSGWEGTGRVEVCEPPGHLVVVTQKAGESTTSTIEATLTADGARTTLVVEERGVPVDLLPAYGAGWQIHLEDLRAALDGREGCDVAARWAELIGHYRSARTT